MRVHDLIDKLLRLEAAYGDVHVEVVVGGTQSNIDDVWFMRGNHEAGITSHICIGDDPR